MAAGTETASLSTGPSERAWSPGFIVLALALALLVRLPHLTQSLWYDELFATGQVLGTWTALAKTLATDIHPPAYGLGMALWIRVFGDGELAVRLPSLLAGLAAVPLLYAVGRSSLGERPARWAVLLLATSPVHAWYSQEARPYALTIALLLLVVLALLRLCDGTGRHERAWLALLALGLGLAAFTHYYMAAFAPVVAALAWWLGAPSWRRLAGLAALVVLASGAFVLAKSQVSVVPTGMPYLRSFGPLEAWHLLTGWLVSGHAWAPRLDGGVALPGLALALELGVAALLLRGTLAMLAPVVAERSGEPGAGPCRRRRGGALLVLLLVLPLALMALTLLGLDRTYIERTALPALPLLLLVLAAGLVRLGPRAAAATLLLLLALVWTGTLLNRDHWTIYKVHPDWRAAAALLGERLEDGSSPPRLYSAYNSPTTLSYYDERIQESKFFVPDGGRIERLRDGLAGLIGAETALGRAVLGQVDAALAAHADQQARREAGMGLEVLDLRREQPWVRGESELWLLVHGEQHPLADAVLAEPGARVLEELRFRSLRLMRVGLEPGS